MNTHTTGGCLQSALHALQTGQPHLAALYMRRGLQHAPAASN